MWIVLGSSWIFDEFLNLGLYIWSCIRMALSKKYFSKAKSATEVLTLLLGKPHFPLLLSKMSFASEF